MKGGSRFRVKDEPDGDMTVEVEFAKPGTMRMDTIDAAGVSFYRSLSIGSDGKVSPFPAWNRISPEHEVVAASCAKTEKGTSVRFTLSSFAWDGVEARRPGWIQFTIDGSPAWPETHRKHVERSRLNLGTLYGDNFGRILRRVR
jgi:hypothetical protein